MINRRSFVLHLPLLYFLYFLPKVVRGFEIAAVRIWPSEEYTRLAIEHLEEKIKIQYSNEKNPDRIIIRIFNMKITKKNSSKLANVNLNQTPIEKISISELSIKRGKNCFLYQPLNASKDFLYTCCCALQRQACY